MSAAFGFYSLVSIIMTVYADEGRVNFWLHYFFIKELINIGDKLSIETDFAV